MGLEQSQGGSSVDAGGDIPDFNELFNEAREELGQTRGALEQTRGELEQVRTQGAAAQKTLARLQQALAGDDPKTAKQIDRVPGLRAQLDEYLQAALDAERRGAPIPLTTNLAVQLFEHAIGYEGDKAAMARELAELKRQVGKANDPGATLEGQAFVDIDGKVITALNTIYGTGDEYDDVKQAQFKAVTELVVDQLKAWRKEEPHKYDQILRQPNARAGLVRQAVERIIPPRARAIMQDDAMQRVEQTPTELVAALRNAREQLAETNDPRWREIVQDIKTEIVEKAFPMRRGRGQLNAAFGA